MKPDIILIGGGGHCKSCIDVIEADGTYQIKGILDLPGKLHQTLFDYRIIGTDEDIAALAQTHEHFLVTIGQLVNPSARIRIFNQLKQFNRELPIIISPLAHVSQYAKIGEGTIVMHQALINAGAEVGKNCIINTKALIEHDARIEDHCHIATGATVNGEVKIGVGTFVGSQSVIRESVEIGERSVIGAGVSVFKSVPPYSKISEGHGQ